MYFRRKPSKESYYVTGRIILVYISGKTTVLIYWHEINHLAFGWKKNYKSVRNLIAVLHISVSELPIVLILIYCTVKPVYTNQLLCSE